MSDPKHSRRIKSVDVTARLLHGLARSREPLTLTQLAQSGRISPSRAHAYIAGMIAAGLVEQSGPYGRYGLGPLARELGTAAVVRHDPLQTIDRAALELQEQTHLTIGLAVWHSSGPVIVRWLRGVHPLPVQVSVGSTIPLTTTAIGRVFLAHLPAKVTAPIVAKELAALANLGNAAPLSQPDLKAAVDLAKESGMAHVRGTLLPDMCATAAPIFEEGKWVVAVLSAIGTGRFQKAGGERKVAKAVLRVTQDATKQLAGIRNV